MASDGFFLVVRDAIERSRSRNTNEGGRAMSFEVEIKFRTDGHDDMARRLAEMGGKPAAVSDQEDVYLSHPARDFAQTGEALRLRSEGSSNRITYKGPRQGGPTKTREEIEIAFV